MKKKIIFSTGGTGGHIFPALNLMKHFFEKDYEVLFVTDGRGNKFLKNFSEFKSYTLNTGTPTNKNFFFKFLSYFLIFFSIIKSIIIIKKEKPTLIFGFGGYVSFPISFASKFFNLPLAIYENNLVIGRANKYLLPQSKKIFISKITKDKFPEKYRNKIFEAGPILSKKIINFPALKKKNNKKNFSILVLGGSQGAEIFGKIIPLVVKKLRDEGYEIEINHQCISEQKNEITNYYNKNNIKNYVFEFNKDILDLILSSDLAISRCGASTTAELVHTLTPFIGIPLPHSVDNHQYLNGKYYENKGCCWLIDQSDFNTENLFNLIIEIIKNKNKLEHMRENMKKNHSRNVYNNIENEINKII